ncbi:AMP-binding protein [Cribrihabitans sp. XS_ASV171]
MTHHVFRALALHALRTPYKAALRSGARCITYGALASFLAASSEKLNGSPRVIGITTSDPLEAALADLALTCHGHVVVHVPPFFSPTQKAHIVEAASIETFIGECEAVMVTERLPRPEDCLPLDGPLRLPVTGARRIIFTSGSSGTPKGVLIGERQMAAAIAGLEKAILPSSDDKHLSLLPMAQLLEQVAGLYLPLLAGAEVCFCPEALNALFGGPMGPVMTTMTAAQPTTTILVPALLARLVSELKATERSAPESLRLIAVGGAMSSPALLAEAKGHGLPVYEGYGLSECCSVVALNLPESARPGTVGKVLDGVHVRIDEGEIVVSGPTVMEGYVGQPPVTGEWRTGDLGRIEDGHLVVEGRKDWLIVTPQGRNINPEWIESCLCADPRIPAAGLFLGQDGQLEIIAVVAAPVDLDHIERLLVDVPQYARPVRIRFAPASQEGLLKSGGGIDRSQLGRLSAVLPHYSLPNDNKECVA